MTKIKICGIKTLPDARAAIEAGADLLGFNFHSASSRFIDIHVCAPITSILRKESPRVQLVGVFVNLPEWKVTQILELCALDLAQLSGDESPELRASLGDRAFKAFHGAPDRQARSYARADAPAFLVDGNAAGSYGGTGVAADWSAAAELAKAYPLMLAGGLRPDNVAEAVRRVRPWGVDVASGVERGPGQKDAGKMRAFVEAVRSAEAEGK
jgi:phosphoribosylanthranilate isomerase